MSPAEDRRKASRRNPSRLARLYVLLLDPFLTAWHPAGELKTAPSLRPSRLVVLYILLISPILAVWLLLVFLWKALSRLDRLRPWAGLLVGVVAGIALGTLPRLHVAWAIVFWSLALGAAVMLARAGKPVAVLESPRGRRPPPAPAQG